MATSFPQGIYLVSCVSVKRDENAPALVKTPPFIARDLYISPWFIKARDVVEKLDYPWFILSAKYGLLAPSDVVTDYDQFLGDMTPTERESWASQVFQKLKDRYGKSGKGLHFVFLAGAHYRRNLEPHLAKWGASFVIPLDRIPFGKQLNRFDRALKGRHAIRKISDHP